MENLILSSMTLYDLRRVMREEFDKALDARKSPATPASDEYQTVENICKKYKISRTTVWKLRRDGKLTARTIGRKLLILQSDVEKVIQPLTD